MAFPSSEEELHGKSFFRLCSSQYNLFDGTGAFLHGARWTPPGIRAIYCGSSLALCTLEVRVHLNSRILPAGFHYGYGSIDSNMGVEIYTPERLQDVDCDWNQLELYAPQLIGTNWINRNDKLFLVVPSVISPEDYTVVINQQHPEFLNLLSSLSYANLFAFDPRLFTHE